MPLRMRITFCSIAIMAQALLGAMMFVAPAALSAPAGQAAAETPRAGDGCMHHPRSPPCNPILSVAGCPYLCAPVEMFYSAVKMPADALEQSGARVGETVLNGRDEQPEPPPPRRVR